jgi:hypothetical protein
VGQAIGRVGKDGATSNGHPHLHFELGIDANGDGSATWGFAGAERVRPWFNGVEYGQGNNQTWRNVTSNNCGASVVGSLPGSRAFRYGDSQHVFARDAGGRLRHWYWAPGMVTAAQQDWGAVAGDPVGFVHGEGQHVFARGVSGSLRHWYWLPGMATAVEQDWGGTVTATPAAFTYGDSQHVFARDTAASMRHWYWSPGMTTPAQQDWGGTLN